MDVLALSPAVTASALSYALQEKHNTNTSPHIPLYYLQRIPHKQHQTCSYHCLYLSHITAIEAGGLRWGNSYWAIIELINVGLKITIKRHKNYLHFVNVFSFEFGSITADCADFI